MTVTQAGETEQELARAMSDYLAVSRQAHLFDGNQYDLSEERAWARLADAIAAATQATQGEPIEEAVCSVSS